MESSILNIKGEAMIQESIVVRALSRIFDLIYLNILWLIGSIPIVTAGASTTALYSVMFKIVENEEGYIARDFWKAYKDNFKQSTVIWILLLLVGMLFGIDFLILTLRGQTFTDVLKVLTGMIFLFYCLELIFVFPVIAKFENTMFNILKNGLFIPVSRLPYALLVLTVTCGSVGVTFLNNMTIMIGAVIWNIVGVAFIVFVNSLILRKLFEPYVEK